MSTSYRFLGALFRSDRKGAVGIIVLLTAGGLVEGVGVFTLLPIIELAVGSPQSEQTQLSLVVTSLLDQLRLPPTLPILLALFILALGAKSVLVWFAMRHVGYSVALVATTLRTELIQSLMRVRWDQFVNESAGQYANAISSETIRAADAYRHACLAAAAAISVLVYAVVAFMISWQVVLFALASGSTIVLLMRGLVRVSRNAGARQTDLLRDLAAHLTDAFYGVKAIKAMGREHLFTTMLVKETADLNRAQRLKVLAGESMRALQEPLLATFLAAGIALLVSFSTLQFSELAVLVFVFYRLLGQVNIAQSYYQAMAVGESAYVALVDRTARLQQQQEDESRSVRIARIEQRIRFDHVRFSYGRDAVLNDLCLTIPARTFVALVGQSGSGKTTIVDLLAKLLSPTSGSIWVDSTNLADVATSAWRNSIGYVPQEMFLFHDSIMGNVTLGDPSVDASAVERALKQAGIWEFVSTLPLGVNTVVGERGALLSGGQRQRVAVARALVTNPQLLILDEVTASLDPETEAELISTLQRLSVDTTVLAITHQPAVSNAASIAYRIVNAQAVPLKGHEVPS